MEPLDPELRRIVRDGLAEAAPGPEVEARVLAGLLRRLPGDGRSDGGPDGGPGDGAAAATAGGKTAAGLKALLLVGLVGGGAVVLTTPPRERSSSSSPAPRPAPPVAPIVSEPAIVEAPALPIVEPTPPPKRATRRPPAAEVDPLLAEIQALAEAEAALASGDASLALRLARALSQTHPGGQLALEREAVELCARCGLREPGAGTAARTFLDAHPDAAVAGKLRIRCADALKK